MFSLKRSSGPNPTNIDPQTTLPNNHGKIRTLKEDFENFQSGKKEAEEKIPADLPPAQAAPPVQKSPAAEKEASLPSVPQVPLSAPKPAETRLSSSSAPQALPAKFSDEKKEVLNPFGSNSYFSDKSPFEEVNKTPQQETASAPPKKKSSALIVVLVSIVLVLAILGGGFYYYWFFMKKPAGAPAAAPTQTAQTEASQKSPQEASPNKNVRALSVDPTAGSGEFQTAFQKMASDFIAGASESNLIEVRPIEKDNQQISISDFVSVSSLNLPEAVTQKFSVSDYSLFIKKENGEARAGLVLKLTDQTGVSEELLAQEKQLPSGVNFLYLGKTLPAAEPTFHSSKYKNADIRYYNFSSPENTSLDYSVIKGARDGYLIFATSRDSIRSVLDYMSEK
ncbi:MAG: hypothetical protein QMD77_02855 [Patescibacteria group bacterium]|nr:hypothetical protein [Patescibacteria group bacterium]